MSIQKYTFIPGALLLHLEKTFKIPSCSLDISSGLLFVRPACIICTYIKNKIKKKNKFPTNRHKYSKRFLLKLKIFWYENKNTLGCGKTATFYFNTSYLFTKHTLLIQYSEIKCVQDFLYWFCTIFLLQLI